MTAITTTGTAQNWQIRKIKAHIAIEIAYPHNPIRIWDGDRDIEISGITGTFAASKIIAEIPNVQIDIDPDQITMAIEMVLVDDAIIDIIRQNSQNGRIPVRLWGLHRDDNSGDWLPSPHDPASPAIRIFQAALDTMAWQVGQVDDTGTRAVRFIFNCQSRFYRDFGVRHRGAEFSAATQALIDATDTSPRFLPYLTHTTEIGRWGLPPEQLRPKKRKFGSGLLGVLLIAGVAAATGGWGLGLAGGKLAAYVGFNAGLALLQKERARHAYNKAISNTNYDQREAIVGRGGRPVRQMVLGRTLAGGDIIFMGVREDIYLQMIIMIADHSIESLDEVLIGNQRYEPGENDGDHLEVVEIPDNSHDLHDLIRISQRIGDAGFIDVPQMRQNEGEASQDWDETNDRATGTAAVGVEFEYDRERRVPYFQLRFLARGFDKVYDPRTNTKSYTNNAALCLAAYINHVGGFPYILSDGTTEHGTAPQGITTPAIGGIDATSLIEAANICDREGFTINGTIDYDEPFDRVLGGLADAMGGEVIFDGWLYRIRPANAYAPVGTINDAMVGATGGAVMRTAREKINAIGGTYNNDPEHNFQEIAYPDWQDDDAIANDGGAINRRHVDFPYTNSAAIALKLASIVLAKARAGEELNLTIPGRRAWQFRLGDRVQVELSDVVNITGIFKIIDMSHDHQANHTEISLIADPDSIYNYNLQTINGLAASVADAEQPLLESAQHLGDLTNLRVYLPDTTGNHALIAPDGTAGSIAFLEVQGIVNSTDIEVQRRIAGIWTDLIISKAFLGETESTINLGVFGGGESLDLRARQTYPDLALVSEWLELAEPFVVPYDTTIPASPAGVRVKAIKTDIVDIVISGVADRDLAGYQLRYIRTIKGGQPDTITTEAEWNNAQVLDFSAAVPVLPGQDYQISVSPDSSGAYRIYARAVDRSGNLSAITQEASTELNFTDASGQIYAATYGVGGDKKWLGVAYDDDFLLDYHGYLIPLTGRTGAMTDAGTDTYDDWNSANGWFMKGARSETGWITMPRITFPTNLDAKLTFNFEGLFPGAEIPDWERLLTRQFRQRHNGTWSAWLAMTDSASICATDIEVRWKLAHNPPKSYGVKSITLAVSVLASQTQPASVVIGSLGNAASIGVVIDYSAQDFIQIPMINAQIASVLTSDASEYVIDIRQQTKTSANLRIKRINRNTYTSGTIIWQAIGVS